MAQWVQSSLNLGVCPWTGHQDPETLVLKHQTAQQDVNGIFCVFTVTHRGKLKLVRCCYKSYKVRCQPDTMSTDSSISVTGSRQNTTGRGGYGAPALP